MLLATTPLLIPYVAATFDSQGERQAEDVEEITDPEELRRIFQVFVLAVVEKLQEMFVYAACLGAVCDYPEIEMSSALGGATTEVRSRHKMGGAPLFLFYTTQGGNSR